MPRFPNKTYLLMILLFSFVLPSDSGAGTSAAALSYRVDTTRWRAADDGFSTWQLDGASLSTGGALQLDPRKAHPGTDPYAAGKYRGGNFYNGGSFFLGEAAGPVVMPAFAFSEAVPSWNATTPPGTWIEVLVRARSGSRWTKWYNLGVWASGQGQGQAAGAVTRHSVSGQTDARAYVDVDTLKIGKKGNPLTATAYQLKFRLFSADRTASPSLDMAAVVVSTAPVTPAAHPQVGSAAWGKVLDVPECSQMVYPDGGEVWCSPTSVAMVLNYWKGGAASCEPAVRAVVRGVYDRVYKGHGNWPFNTAYAASAGMESYVTRFTSLSQAEQWIEAGVPLIMSVSWGRNQLTGAPIPASSGHLVVLAGFDAKGNPVVNDPAAATNGGVQRTYLRSELEKIWLQSSGGTAYIIYPAGKEVPGR